MRRLLKGSTPDRVAVFGSGSNFRYALYIGLMILLVGTIFPENGVRM